MAHRHEPFFVLRVIRGIDQAGVFVQKDGLRFLEGDAVLHQVGLGLAAIPGKLNITHGIILAISGQPPGAKARTAENWLPTLDAFGTSAA